MQEPTNPAPEDRHSGGGSGADLCDPLIAELHRILRVAEAFCVPRAPLNLATAQDLVTAQGSDDLDAWSKAASLIHDLSQGLRDLVVADSRFLGNEIRQVHVGNGGLGFYPEFFGPTMVRHLLQTQNPEETVRWLEKVLRRTEVARGKSITALWGAPIERGFQLTPKILIVPFAELPDSDEKTQIENLAFPSAVDFSRFPVNLRVPQSALVTEIEISPFTGSGDTPPPSVDFETQLCHREIGLALGIAGPRLVLEGPHWMVFDDPDFKMFGSGPSSRFHELMPMLLPQSPTLDPSSSPVVQGFLKLEEQARKRVLIALKRLQQSFLRSSAGERALDLAIAFEILTGDGQANEITHKVRVRSTRFIGGSNDERHATSTCIKRVYDLRSKLVHTGEVLLTPANVEATESATRLLSKLVRRIIQRGSIPDWAEFDIYEQPGETLL